MAVKQDDKAALRALIGKRLEHAITAAGYRRPAHCADDMGIDRRYLYQYLNGSKMAPHYMVRFIAKKSGQCPAYLYGLSDQPVTTKQVNQIDILAEIGIEPEQPKVFSIKGALYIVDLADKSGRVAGVHILEIDGERVIETIKHDLTGALKLWDIDAEEPRSEAISGASIVGRVVAKIEHF